jgi:polyisoprenoid-binding protein YceI
MALLTLLFIAGFNSAFAATTYSVDSNNSSVNFSTIKQQYVVEPAVFKNVQGTISASGNAKISIALNSVETQIPIRDARLKSLFFEVVKFPKAVVSAKINMNKIKSVSGYIKMKIPATLEFYGHSKKITLNILLAKTKGGRLLITSMKPIIVNAGDFGIPSKNLVQLAKTVGGFAISNKVPVNFVLTFKPKSTK